jgi:hypothetical protein
VADRSNTCARGAPSRARRTGRYCALLPLLFSAHAPLWSSRSSDQSMLTKTVERTREI